jgi:hypothetical protein
MFGAADAIEKERVDGERGEQEEGFAVDEFDYTGSHDSGKRSQETES